MIEEAHFPAEKREASPDHALQQKRLKRALAYGVAGIMLATSGAIAVRDQQLIDEKDAVNENAARRVTKAKAWATQRQGL